MFFGWKRSFFAEKWSSNKFSEEIILGEPVMRWVLLSIKWGTAVKIMNHLGFTLSQLITDSNFLILYLAKCLFLRQTLVFTAKRSFFTAKVPILRQNYSLLWQIRLGRKDCARPHCMLKLKRAKCRPARMYKFRINLNMLKWPKFAIACNVRIVRPKALTGTLVKSASPSPCIPRPDGCFFFFVSPTFGPLLS